MLETSSTQKLKALHPLWIPARAYVVKFCKQKKRPDWFGEAKILFVQQPVLTVSGSNKVASLLAEKIQYLGTACTNGAVLRPVSLQPTCSTHFRFMWIVVADTCYLNRSIIRSALSAYNNTSRNFNFCLCRTCPKCTNARCSRSSCMPLLHCG